MREYRPNILHVWQLKTFWSEGIMNEMDVDFILFEAVEMSPAIQKNNLNQDLRGLVEEMILHKQQVYSLSIYIYIFINV